MLKAPSFSAVLKLACAVFALFLFASHASAGQMAMTVRAEDGAALVSGDESVVEKLKDALTEMQEKRWRLDELGEMLDEKYGKILKIELFRKLRIEDSGVFESLRMPLRRAVLLAALPPVEGLSLDEAREMLEAFRIRVTWRAEYDRLTDQEKIREAFIAETQLVVLSGVAPDSEVEIVMIKKE